MYRHFPTKGALFEAVAAARVTDLVADADAHADADDPGEAFFGFLARLREEATHKRDLSEAITVPGDLPGALHASLGVLLHRAQDTGAVRADLDTPDVLALLKGLLAGIHGSAGAGTDGRLPDRLFAVVVDGLRGRPPDAAPGGPAAGASRGVSR